MSFKIREKCSFLEQEKMVICYYLSNGKVFKLNPYNNLRKNIEIIVLWKLGGLTIILGSK